MRPAFIQTLTKFARRDESIYLITADTGFKVFEDFQETFPDRYLNIGVAEAGMIGVAAGLALGGKRVFVYGIVPFVTLRCIEQIRVDLCYMNLPVTVVGVGQGLTYGPAGVTHHSIEDIAMTAALPNMTVVCPADPVETALATEAVMDLPGPCYLRLGKTGEPVVHTDGLASFAIGRAVRIRPGDGPALIATGNMVPTAVRVGGILAEAGLDPEVVSMHTVKPIDREAIVELAGRCGTLVTIEEHSLIGGLGSLVAGVVADEGLHVRLLRFGIADEFADVGGSQQYLRDRFGLGAEDIAARIMSEAPAPGGEGGGRK